METVRLLGKRWGGGGKRRRSGGEHRAGDQRQESAGECQAPEPPHAGDQAGLLSLARARAAGAGDAAPTSITFTTLSRQDAVTAMAPGDMLGQADHERPVWLVVMHGAFVLGSASRPSGAPAPTGNVLALSVDRVTGCINDLSLGTNDPVLPSGAPPLVPLTDDSP